MSEAITIRELWGNPIVVEERVHNRSIPCLFLDYTDDDGGIVRIALEEDAVRELVEAGQKFLARRKH